MIQVSTILILTSIKAITQSPIMRLLHHFSPFSTTIIITFHNFATFIGELVIIHFELILQYGSLFMGRLSTLFDVHSIKWELIWENL